MTLTPKIQRGGMVRLELKLAKVADLTASLGLHLTVDGPARVVHSSNASQLDLMFVSNICWVDCCSVLYPMADHSPAVHILSVIGQRQTLLESTYLS